MKICSVCKQSKELAHFNKKGSDCKLCHRTRMNLHYKNNKQYYIDKAKIRDTKTRNDNRQKLIDYLLEHPCLDCYNTDVEVLQFDHVDPSMKTYNISSILTRPWSTVEKEIIKCEVRCANCHIKKTRRQFGHWTFEIFSASIS